jgi:hypothetical protein
MAARRNDPSRARMQGCRHHAARPIRSQPRSSDEGTARLRVDHDSVIDIDRCGAACQEFIAHHRNVSAPYVTSMRTKIEHRRSSVDGLGRPPMLVRGQARRTCRPAPCARIDRTVTAVLRSYFVLPPRLRRVSPHSSPSSRSSNARASWLLISQPHASATSSAADFSGAPMRDVEEAFWITSIATTASARLWAMLLAARST